MRRWQNRYAFHVLAVIGVLLSSSPARAQAEDSAIAAAVQLLPKRPPQVVLIDANEAAADVRATLLRLDAFVVKGSHAVYLTRQSAILRAAARGSDLQRFMLASIIWHEMAHLDGANEAEAQRQEEALWRRYLLDGRVDQLTALRYLSALNSRHVKDAIAR
jgi:hypothetical protein